MGHNDNVLKNMRKYIKIYCQSCVFYTSTGNIAGMCSHMAGLNNKDVLILDKINIINKVRNPSQRVYNPIIVANTFGCIYYKEK